MLIGICKFKFDVLGWATGTAGVAVFLLVFKFQPVGFEDKNMPTLVFLKRMSDSTTIKSNIDLRLRINGETKKSDNGENNQSHTFQFVSSKQID